MLGKVGQSGPAEKGRTLRNQTPQKSVQTPSGELESIKKEKTGHKKRRLLVLRGVDGGSAEECQL